MRESIRLVKLLFLMFFATTFGCGGGGTQAVQNAIPPQNAPISIPEAGRLTFVGIPDNIVPGVPFQVEVALLDSSGNLILGQTFDVQIEAERGQLTGSQDSILQNGRVVFSDLTLTGSGPFILTVAAGDLRTTITIEADLRGIPAQIRYLTQPSDIRVQEPFSPEVSLEVLDIFGNRIRNSVTISLSLRPQGANIVGPTSKTSQNGIVSFSQLTIDSIGTYQLSATAPGLAGAISGSFNVLEPIRFGNFRTRRDFEAPRGANVIRTGNLDGDEVEDLVRLHSNGVSVSLNKSDGTLTESLNIVERRGFADGDLALLNSDSNLDFVAVEDGGVGTLFVGIGDGNGSFQVREDGDFGEDVRKLVLGDFNSDQVTDVAALLFDGDEVVLRLGQGDGTFGALSRLPLTSLNGARLIGAGDLDGDGFEDLVITGGNIEPPEVYFGFGDGSFETPAATLGFSTAANGLELRDLNGDLIDDLVLARFLPQEDVVVLLGTATKNFTISSTTSLKTPREILVKDVTGEGNLDILTSIPDGFKDRVVVMAGEGNGTFSRTNDFVSAFGEPKLASLDTNADGVNDIITVNPLSATLSVYTSLSSSDFRVPIETSPFRNDPRLTLPGDFDEDGETDILLGGTGELLLGQGDGTFSIGSPINNTSGVGAVGDVDGDNHLDAVFTNSGSDQVLIHYGRGDGSFDTVQVLSTVDRPGEIVIVDADLDGRKDLVLESSSEGLTILSRNLDRTFGAPQRIVLPNRSVGRRLATGFLNDDQYPDFALPNSSFALVILSDGTGGFLPPAEYTAGNTLTDISLGDLNEDGSLDLAFSSFADDDLRVLYNQGDGTFSTPQSLPGLDRFTKIAISDLDLDGHLDITGLMDRFSSFMVYYGNGDSTYKNPEIYGIGADPEDLVVVDLDKDGAGEVISPDSSQRRMTTVLNQAFR